MMGLDTAIFDFLSSESSVTDIVGDRIWRKHRQTNELPCLVYFNASERPDSTAKYNTNSTTYSYQFDCFSLNDDDNSDLMVALFNAFNGYSGEMGDVTVKNVKLRGSHDTSMPPSDGSDVWLYKLTGDFTFKVNR